MVTLQPQHLSPPPHPFPVQAPRTPFFLSSRARPKMARHSRPPPAPGPHPQLPPTPTSGTTALRLPQEALPPAAAQPSAVLPPTLTPSQDLTWVSTPK